MDDLYEKIDADEETTDAEKRETYFAELENDNAESEWQDEHGF